MLVLIVPASLSGSVSKAAASVAAGGSLAGLLSSAALALGKGVMHHMWWNKFAFSAVCLGAIGLGLGVIAPWPGHREVTAISVVQADPN